MSFRKIDGRFYALLPMVAPADYHEGKDVLDRLSIRNTDRLKHMYSVKASKISDVFLEASMDPEQWL